VRLCGFPGCTRRHHARDLCQGHYRQRQKGQPLGPLLVYRPRGERPGRVGANARQREYRARKRAESLALTAI
jgi:hypothetical protein